LWRSQVLDIDVIFQLFNIGHHKGVSDVRAEKEVSNIKTGQLMKARRWTAGLYQSVGSRAPRTEHSTSGIMFHGDAMKFVVFHDTDEFALGDGAVHLRL
jgi:hypothetical protein